jgi:transposase
MRSVWPFNAHEYRRRVRELAVRDVVVNGQAPLAVAVTWGVLVADVMQWVRDAEADGNAEAEADAAAD